MIVLKNEPEENYIQDNVRNIAEQQTISNETNTERSNMQVWERT